MMTGFMYFRVDIWVASSLICSVACESRALSTFFFHSFLVMVDSAISPMEGRPYFSNKVFVWKIHDKEW